MKKIIYFIIKLIIFLVVFLLILFSASAIYYYLISNNGEVTLDNVVSYVQSVGNEFVDFTFTDKNSVNLILDDDITNTNFSSNNNISKNKYYYNQLDANAKTIYIALENNIDNLKKENYTINFSKQFNNLLHETSGQEQLNKSFQSALDAFFYDYPELFYIDISKISLLIKCTSVGPITTYTVAIAPQDNKNYLHSGFNSETDVDVAISKIENIRNSLINKISNNNDYTKIKQVHDTLVNSLEYDSTLNKNNAHNIYGALIQKSVVCEGYAKSFKYILDSLGIENILVSGTATNSSNETESHMWNYVKLNGDWYGVDVTWDDPVIIGGYTNSNLRHDYFLKGNSTFIKSHIPSGRISDTGMLFSFPNLSQNNYK